MLPILRFSPSAHQLLVARLGLSPNGPRSYAWVQVEVTSSASETDDVGADAQRLASATGHESSLVAAAAARDDVALLGLADLYGER